jgi:hypothetical protein
MQPVERPDWAGADRELHPAVQLLGVAELQLWEDDCELVLAHAAGEVCASHYRLEPLRFGGDAIAATSGTEPESTCTCPVGGRSRGACGGQ